MKTKIIIVLCALFVISLTIGGYGWMKHEEQMKQESEKKTFITKQEKRIVKFFKYNVPSFKSITFTGNDTTPTGGLFIDGYINNDKDLNFSAQISLGAGENNFDGDSDYSNKLFKLMRKDIKSVSEIEKIERQQKVKKPESK
ncbi:DUF1433 domain-containing protein [Terrilactibacillus sp. S3-3]|nr:DUF1433 domain-containing protein [Terrilactibacillus sp. S3-3]